MCIKTSPSYSLCMLALQLKLIVRCTNPITTSLVCWCPAEEGWTIVQKETPLCITTRTFYHWEELSTVRAASAKPGNKQLPAALKVLSAVESHHCSSLGVVTEVLAFHAQASLVISFCCLIFFPIRVNTVPWINLGLLLNDLWKEWEDNGHLIWVSTSVRFNR